MDVSSPERVQLIFQVGMHQRNCSEKGRKTRLRRLLQWQTNGTTKITLQLDFEVRDEDELDPVRPFSEKKTGRFLNLPSLP